MHKNRTTAELAVIKQALAQFPVKGLRRIQTNMRKNIDKMVFSGVIVGCENEY